jgi:CheY-like chemotaxis protein
MNTPRENLKERVLVADDHRDSAEGLRMFLEMFGCEVRIAQDGPEAVQAAATFLPDVACLDIGMPTIDGYEVARRIREQPWGKSITLVAITGWGGDGDKKRAQEAGFDHHLTKPVNFAELKGVLTRKG